ncbi:hypothetical protein BKA01_004501 [Pseudonocardia eucalypti]|uniref:hypothetical protein n=1 Tax=Pseudonocardia eucalypti TaxID=648755 RepID=UPI00160E7BCA|nr:hypothetical protein [Pseudonocardia eucalypti]
MRRVATGPVSLADLPVQASPSDGRLWQDTWPEGTRRRVYARDEGNTDASTFLLNFPPGYARPQELEYLRHNPRGRFEYHTCHEELFVLNGVFKFDDWYEIKNFGYFNHPPYWLHPAHQHAPEGVDLFIKNSAPVDFLYADIPPDWDRTEYLADGYPHVTRSRPVTGVEMADIPWEPVLDPDGAPTGMEGKHLWDDLDGGWTTWLMRVPAGWTGTGPAAATPGGDEFLVLEGDLTLDRGASMTLGPMGYLCDPETFVYPGAGTGSEAGCLAVRWTRGDPLGLPTLRF